MTKPAEPVVLRASDIAVPADFDAQLSACMRKDVFRFKRRYADCKLLEGEKLTNALSKLLGDIERSQARVKTRQQALPKIIYPDLPVSERQDDIKQAIQQHQVVIIAGETGSGKTTQIPKMCLELGRGVRGTIAHTQPRRLAARSVASRIAEELDTEIGQSVGFKIRFSDHGNQDTHVKLMTDGILLAEIQHDRFLQQYDTIIIDEAHERSLNIDFLLGYLKQLLPKRPDLKLIITSATIDPERFAKHFFDAPIISVSGRTYPVEMRYRSLVDEEEELDLGQGIINAVSELRKEKPGDILIFLSGEREIRETEQLLKKQPWSNIEIVPLYARLSAAEQNKIFASHRGQRIVLATNVAETSLTVPGIRYVIDPGYARISRYSYRSKVQRLPIEAISQASANQRAGRCGRVANGICIRLYSEDDYLGRSEFTDPEILRTNLASVILKMLALGLGDINAFPFVQPPDPRFINDGYRLLQELQAISLHKKHPTLTPLGKQIARLPIDPRYARMVIAATAHRALQEVVIITAGLSIQDPKERPREKQQAADECHQQFADKQSDFISILNLYAGFCEQQANLTQNQLRKWCKSNFIHYLRMREWQDIISQVKQSLKELKLDMNQQTPDYDDIHISLATGLLSHLGLKDKGREYLGARNSKLMIFPGSPMAKQAPKWMMAAELVETSQLFARVVAKIEPHWIEPLCTHLSKSSLSEPFWSKKQGAAQAYEKVTLFGLPIIPRRTVNISQRDPVVAKGLFISEGLVNGLTKLNYAFLQDNQALLTQGHELEAKSRRRDWLVDEEVLGDFYAEKLPEHVVSEAAFRKWFKQHKDIDLRFDPELVFRKDPDAVSPNAYPDIWKQGNISLPLSYVFEPNQEDDGVSLLIPIGVLNQLKNIGFDWLVPGFRHELIVALIKSLPKRLRRNFVPVPDYADACLGELSPVDKQGAPVSLIDALTARLFAMTGVKITPEDWAEQASINNLPKHLMMRFVVVDDNQSVIAHGRDLPVLQANLQDRIKDTLEQVASPELERDNITQWDFDSLPESFTHETAGFAIKGYPALVAKRGHVAIELFDLPHEAEIAHQLGLYKLIQLSIPSPLKYVQEKLPNKAKLGLYFNPFGNVKELIDDCILAGIAQLETQFQAESATSIREQTEFMAVCDYVREHINAVVLEIAAKVEKGLTCANRIQKSTKGSVPLNMLEAVGHIKAHLDSLVFKQFVFTVSSARLDDWHRYLLGLERRVEKLKVDATKDRMHQVQIDKVTAQYEKKCQSIQHGEVMTDNLIEVKWMIEELRVSFFAQQLGTAYPISVKRIEQALNSE
jgi:ATP-dependent helicase HrpA